MSSFVSKLRPPAILNQFFSSTSQILEDPVTELACCGPVIVWGYRIIHTDISLNISTKLSPYKYNSWKVSNYYVFRHGGAILRESSTVN